jgi:hypothetical protein
MQRGFLSERGPAIYRAAGEMHSLRGSRGAGGRASSSAVKTLATNKLNRSGKKLSQLPGDAGAGFARRIKGNTVGRARSTARQKADTSIFPTT